MFENLRFAYDPADTDEVRLQKRVILLVAGSCCLAGTVWTAMYVAVFGWGLISMWPALFVVIVGSALVASHLTRNHWIAVYAQIACIVYVTAGIQWCTGGLWDSGLVLAWAFCGPLAALIFLSVRASIGWFLLYVLNLAITVAFDDTFSRFGPGTTPGIRAAFFLMNMGVASAVVFLFAGYFMTTATRERRRADALLLNILPEAIAPRLKAGEKTIADRYESASVLFADMVGSTPLFAGMSAEETVSWLNEVFILFDRLIEAHGLEKIRTIGDNYMVAAGVPTRRPDHAQAATALALDMAKGIETIAPRNGKRMQFRFGIHSGPLVAGVIGETKFQYDLWGDTVNLAARMESHSEAGRIHVSAATRALIDGQFECVPRGTIEVKGKGPMETFYVVGPKA